MASDIVNKSVSWAGKTRYNNIVLFNLLAQGQFSCTQKSIQTYSNKWYRKTNLKNIKAKSLESNQYSWNF